MTAPSRGSLALAGAASSLTLAFVPAADILREALRRLFPSTFVLVVTTACVVLAVAALALTVARLGRRRHWRRLVVLAVAAASACGYALVVATGNAEVNAVERVHLLQYGVVGALWYQVWRHHGDLRAVVLPLAASFGVGTLDELVQWYIPVRIGELHDVLMNGAAAAAGVACAAVAGDPLPRAAAGSPGTLARAAGPSAALLVAFVALVHVGWEIRDGEGHAFRSVFPAGVLEATSADRARRWQTDPPVVQRRLGREDRYASEALWHVQARNRAVAEGRLRAAWGENRILEQYYAPILDAPTWRSADGHRWPMAQRADIEARVDRTTGYESDAHPYPIHLWPGWAVWAAAGAMAIGPLLLARERREPLVNSR